MKGNRTNSFRDATKITKYNELYHTELEEYKRFAAARRNQRKYTQEAIGNYWEKLGSYVAEKQSSGKPMTIAGIQLALNIDQPSWSRWNDGEHDYILEEYIHDNNITEDDVTYIEDIPFHINGDGEAVLLMPYSMLTQKAYQMIQEQLEENCYTNKGNPAGSIFSLKANFKWREDDTPQHLVQQLVIADKERATELLEMASNR